MKKVRKVKNIAFQWKSYVNVSHFYFFWKKSLNLQNRKFHRSKNFQKSLETISYNPTYDKLLGDQNKLMQWCATKVKRGTGKDTKKAGP